MKKPKPTLEELEQTLTHLLEAEAECVSASDTAWELSRQLDVAVPISNAVHNSFGNWRETLEKVRTPNQIGAWMKAALKLVKASLEGKDPGEVKLSGIAMRLTRPDDKDDE
jgi:hypothetical protein